MEYIKKVAETIGLQAESNGNFDGITTAGLTFGGYPVGSDEYIQRFLIAKSKKFSERIDTIIKNSKCKDAGVLISITRKCIASSWSYLTRVIAPRHWLINCYLFSTVVHYNATIISKTKRHEYHLQNKQYYK
jgi:hypothetical protein